jgi:ankyrin repeat protein
MHEAVAQDDASRVSDLLEKHPTLKTAINDPVGPFDTPAITRARSRAMLDVLLAAGADLNAKSRWWAGGFGVLHTAAPDVARHAIERGAQIDVHAAARLGLLEKLRTLIAADPGLVHARGGDGQTPLHFAATVEIARFLVEHGADLNVLDVDHESTPAQYMVRERLEVARYLVECGCRTDLLLAAALGDSELVRRHLDADPAVIHLRVGPEYFPMQNPRAGGTIYQWTLGANVSAHDVARVRGHTAIFQLLMDRSPAGLKLLAACWAGDDALVRPVLVSHPDAATKLSDSERRQPALAAQNNATEAVRLMLQSGLPVDARGQHGGTPLHWAAFHGNVAMVRVVLPHHPPLEATDADYSGTPLDWALHGSKNSWQADTGDYPGVVAALLDAGARVTDAMTGGTEVVQKILRRHRDSAAP